MKTTKPQIHLKLFTSKTLADGNHPIVVNIAWKGKQKVISTSFSCTPSQWDKKNECLKKSYPNAASINKALNEKKQQYVLRMLQLEEEGNSYTLQDLLSNARSPSDCTFIQLVHKYAQERKLKVGTMRSYKTVINALVDIIGNSNFKVTDIKPQHLEEICNYPKANSTGKLYLEKTLAIMQYAIDLKMKVEIPADLVKKLKLQRKVTVKPKSLDRETIWKLEEWFVEQNATTPLTFNSEVFACCLFLCIYKLQGIAPVDLFKLRKQDCEFKTIDGNEVFIARSERSKTGKPIFIVVDKDIYSRFLQPLLVRPIKAKHYKRKRQETSFLSEFLDSEEDAIILNQMIHLDGVVNRNLKTLALRLGIPEFTLYAARHSYASIQLNAGTNMILVAQAMARSVDKISTYVSNLMKETDLLRINDNV